MSKIMIKIMICVQDNDVVHLPPQNLTLQSGPIIRLASHFSRVHQKYDCTIQLLAAYVTLQVQPCWHEWAIEFPGGGGAYLSWQILL